MSHKITITLSTGNAAFGEDESFEIGRILKEYGDRLVSGELNVHTMAVRLSDANGNKVGTVRVEPC